MLSPKKKRKTGTQIAQNLAQDLSKSVADTVQTLSTQNLPLKIICTIWLTILTFSIAFGIYGWASRMNDISKKEQSVENLENELASLEKQLINTQELKIKLKDDPITIEAIARSYGMSKKGEKVFYFLD